MKWLYKAMGNDKDLRVGIMLGFLASLLLSIGLVELEAKSNYATTQQRSLIKPDVERMSSATVTSSAQGLLPADSYEIPQAPAFDRSGVWGMGFVQVSTCPSRQACEARAKALRTLLLHYQGKQWNPHLSIVPWFEGEHTLLFNNVWPESAEAICEWLQRVGWRGSGDGIGGERICRFHRTWYPEKP